MEHSDVLLLGPSKESGEVGQGKRFSSRNPREVRGDCILGCRTYYEMQRENNSGIEQRVLCEAYYGMFMWQTKSREVEDSGWIEMEQAWGSRQEGDRKSQSHICRLLGSMLVWALHLITAGYPIFLPNSICNHMVCECVVFSVSVCEHWQTSSWTTRQEGWEVGVGCWKETVGLRNLGVSNWRDQHLEANYCKGSMSKTSYWRHLYCDHTQVCNC